MAEDEETAQVSTFTSQEAYVYAPIPPASSIGHRAEVWNVDKWLKEVRLRVLTNGDQLSVQLNDPESGELFAECPLPSDGTPLTTTIEPVIDSSRYFVFKVVDRATKHHAFIGVGFRDRSDASGFTAALDDYRQYLRRKKEAEVMREQFESKEADPDIPAEDLSLKPGQTIKLTISKSSSKKDSSTPFSGLFARHSTLLSPAPTAGGLKLPPPPAKAGSPSPSPSPSTTSDASSMRVSIGASTSASTLASQLSALMTTDESIAALGIPSHTQPSTATESTSPDSTAAADDEWGDFVG